MITSDDIRIVAPPPSPNDLAPGEAVHPLACFHRKWRVDLVRSQEEYHAAVRAVDAILTDKQRRSAPWDDLDAAFGMVLCAQQDHLVAVLAAHFPGIAPAIRAVAYHADDDMDGTGTAGCCWPEAPVHEAVAEDFVRAYVRKVATLDEELGRVLGAVKDRDPAEYRRLHGLMDRHLSAS